MFVLVHSIATFSIVIPNLQPIFYYEKISIWATRFLLTDCRSTRNVCEMVES
jgi:hypothetical protein